MNDTRTLSFERLKAFFHPRSIALVGATDNSRWSVYTFQNLRTFGFPGPVYCVNPNREIVHGERAFKSLRDLPEPVDLAYIMVPTQRVYAILQEAAEVGITNVVILTSGFSEMGEQGRLLEQKMLDFAREHAMVVLGPNGNGFVNITAHTMPYGLPITPPLARGPVGVVLQSGALASAVITMAQARHIGLSYLVSMGNETMISATDMMDYLIEDDETRVIAVFLESIRQPEQFKRVARKALARKKPIVAFKIGASDISARTALAHTGALVGDDAMNDAVFKQLGIVRVHSLEDLLITAGLLGYTPPLPGRRAAIVTPSGGACDILSDRAQEEGIVLPEFAMETAHRLRQIVPEFSTVHNPLDVTGYIVVDRTLMQRALNVAVEDPNMDFLVCLTDPVRTEPPDPAPIFAQVETLGQTIRSARLPVVVMMNTCIDITPFGRVQAERGGIHYVGGMEHGMRALGHALWWYETCRNAEHHTPAAEALPAITRRDLPGGILPEYMARDLLQEQGVPVVPGALARDADEAHAIAHNWNEPLALKIQSPDILHKSDVGGVVLNVAPEHARTAFSNLLERVVRNAPDAHIDGVLLSPMRTASLELLVSVVDDPVWGLMLTVGLGGIWVEVLRDTSVRMLPVRSDEIRTMLHELRGFALLHGVRGQSGVNIDALVDVITRIAHLAQTLNGSLETLEINPLLVQDKTIEVADVLLSWKTRAL